MFPKVPRQDLKKENTRMDTVPDRMSILLIDDEQRLLLTSARLFRKLGMPIETACGGERALEKLAHDSFDVVFLDMKMPGMDGHQTLAEIRRLHPGVDVIILTGHATREDAVECLRRGARDYLVKPVSARTMLEKAREVRARDASFATVKETDSERE